MEYLLAQSNRGNLLSQQTDTSDIPLEVSVEDEEDEYPDVTIPQAYEVASQVIL